MDADEIDPRPSKPTSGGGLGSRILDPLSIAELESYIGELEAEIARVRAAIAAKRSQRHGAEALFKR